MQKIGLGVIGINPTNMGSTMSLLSGEANLRYELRALCAKRGNTLAKYAQDLGVSYWTTEYQELIRQKSCRISAAGGSNKSGLRFYFSEYWIHSGIGPTMSQVTQC